MDEAERTGVGAALRRPNKGPANATIRTVTLDEADAAFNGSPEEAAVSMPGANKVNGPGGRGSVAGIRTGTKEAGGGIDVRAAENLRLRQQRQAGAGRQARPATVVPPARTPVQTPSQAPLEPWELSPADLHAARQADFQEAQSAQPPAAPKRDYYADFPPGDRLAVALADALAILDKLPEGFELAVGGGPMDPEGVGIVMGLGFLIGKGYAAYCGNNHYRITEAGRAAARRGEAGHA